MFKFTPSLLAVAAVFLSTNPAFSNPENAWLSQGTNSNPPKSQVREEKVTFGCEISKNIPITFAEVIQGTNKGKTNILSWVSKHFPDPEQAQKLCQTVAEKLQLAYNSSGLRDMGIYVGKINPAMPQEYVFCLKQSEGNSCNDQDLVLFSSQTKCVDPKAILYDMSSKEIVETQQRPLCSGTKGDFSTRLRFKWFPF